MYCLHNIGQKSSKFLEFCKRNEEFEDLRQDGTAWLHPNEHSCFFSRRLTFSTCFGAVRCSQNGSPVLDRRQCPLFLAGFFELNLGTEEEKFRHPISKDGFAHGL